MGQASEISQVPPAEVTIAALHEMFNSKSQGGLMWNNLTEDDRRAFCFTANLKGRHVNMRLDEMDSLELARLHRAIKRIATVASKFNSISLSDFK
ncbi:hypothetical protein PVK64_04450 [Aliivibrio sp. S4TY2]|uniref:hypothetical protein n=1 Tax=unclassified Aliivibrio TaxID=2645654 RepID=UPI00237927CC|nr:MULTISPECIES: hypothetical protein [unclassified Aliivibrio]MDD9155438.1 hypothetical protein [Aliivibrio sp. S4TY2]MDD9161565.1 hypothetical protein [Aliivibrio sp. S4TY1]MDD9165595.1 hypothetical protein [Aliivibrio sp. S4MY2]MDD9169594.1 hypothetical protein [Aliivibrio sp. S4MY4]MDD9186587.1 hypothetical protein [Aliivibrio sp. S4MY3]